MMTEPLPSDEPIFERRSPLELLNETIQHLGGSPAIDPTRGESRLASLLETLIVRSDERLAEIREDLSRTRADTDARLGEAMRAITACIESVENAPKITPGLIESVSNRLEQIEERLPSIGEASAAPLRKAIAGLESRLDHLASASLGEAGMADQIAGLGTQIEAIAARLDGQAGALKRIEVAQTVMPSKFAVIENRLGAMSAANEALTQVVTERLDRVNAALPEGAVSTLRAMIDRLSEQVSGWRNSVGEKIDAAVGDIGTKIGERASGADMSRLGERVGALGDRIDALAESGATEAALQPVKKSLADLNRRVQEQKPMVEGVDADLKAIRHRLDTAPHKPIDPDVIERIGSEIAEVRTIALAQARQVDTISGWVRAAGAQPPDLSALAAGMAAGLAAVREKVEWLSQRVEDRRDAGTAQALQAIEKVGREVADVRDLASEQARQVGTISAWVDLAGPAPPDFAAMAEGMAALRDQVDGLSRRIEEQAATPKDKALVAIESKLAAVLKQIDKRAVDPAIAALNGLLAEARQEMTDLRIEMRANEERLRRVLDEQASTIADLAGRLAQASLPSAPAPSEAAPTEPDAAVAATGAQLDALKPVDVPLTGDGELPAHPDTAPLRRIALRLRRPASDPIEAPETGPADDGAMPDASIESAA